MADGQIIDRVEAVPTALYRHFAADGSLLYVGISLSPTYRLSQHRDASQWFREIASIRVEWLPNRVAALDAEREAIRSESPKYNKVHRLADSDDDAHPTLADASRIEMIREFARYRSAYSIKGAAEATGLRESGMRLALFHREVRFYDGGSGRIVISGWALIEYMEALEAGTVRVRTNPRRPDGTTEKLPSIGEIIAGRYNADELADRL